MVGFGSPRERLALQRPARSLTGSGHGPGSWPITQRQGARVTLRVANGMFVPYEVGASMGCAREAEFRVDGDERRQLAWLDSWVFAQAPTLRLTQPSVVARLSIRP
jgi:hypothetical protein